jgi:hypothetical protein
VVVAPAGSDHRAKGRHVHLVHAGPGRMSGGLHPLRWTTTRTGHAARGTPHPLQRQLTPARLTQRLKQLQRQRPLAVPTSLEVHAAHPAATVQQCMR